MKIVYAKEPRVIAFGGMRVTLRPGDPWDGDDPLVQAHPDAFVDGPRVVRSTRNSGGVIDVPVEQATRAPGEKRATRRTRQAGE